MTMQILARTVHFSDDGDVTLLAFADDPDRPLNYMILSFANEPDEQDLALGMTGIHLEMEPLAIQGYDLVDDIIERGNAVLVRLTPDAAQDAACDPQVVIELEVDTINGTPIADVIQRFKERLRPQREK